MKKSIRLAIFLIVLSSFAFLSADVTFEVGAGTDTWDRPFYNWYTNFRTQTIYYASELTAAGMSNGDQIDYLHYNFVLAPGQVNQEFVVRMGHTANTDYTTNDFITTGLTQVYSNPEDLTTAAGWTGFLLDTPFIWNGTDNLVIDVAAYNGASNYTSSGTVYSTSQAETRSLNWYTDSDYNPCATPDQPTIGNYLQSPFMPNVRLIQQQAGTPGMPVVVSPADGATDQAPSGTLEWTFGDNTNAYDLWYGEAGSLTQVVTGGAATPGGTGTYSYSGMYDTDYQWYVVAWNTAVDPDVSQQGPIWDFTTGGYIYGPTPVDGAEGIDNTSALDWSTATPATTTNVYFGTDPVVGNNPVFNNVTAPWPPTMDPTTTYYWQVEATPNGVDWYSSPVWNFTTWRLPGPALTLPWTEDFESAGPTLEFTTPQPVINGIGEWEYQKTENGRLSFQHPSVTAHGGTQCAALDTFTDGTNSINYMIAHLNMSSYDVASDDVILTFWHYMQGEESQVNDRVWARGASSDDWVEIHNLLNTQQTTTWVEIEVNLSAALDAAGQNFSESTQLRFGQEDNYGFTSDGRAFDDISLDVLSDAPVFSITPTTHDFGEVDIPFSASQDFTIENVGGGTLTIANGNISIINDAEGNFSLDPITYPIDLGYQQTYTFTVNFAPQSAGAKTADIQIIDNVTRQINTVPISGTGTTPPVYTVPYSQNFDSWALGTIPSDDWEQATDDDMDWTIDNLGTSSSGTGPSDDMTGGGNYLYTETSGYNLVTAIITTPFIDLDMTPSRLSFYYHMYGAAMGTLSVDIFHGGSWTEIWTLSGDQGDQWINTVVSLAAYSGQVKFRFNAYTGSTYTSDMAIDNVVVEELPSNPIYNCTPTSADFGEINIGVTSTTTFTVSNMGAGTLNITNVAISGVDAADFTFVADQTIPYGITGTPLHIDVTFDPQTIGTKTASLDITDDLTRTVYNYPLTGSAVNYNYGGGGAPEGGYYFANSTTGAVDSPSQPTYSWIDISATGTSVTPLPGDDDATLVIPIGFDFPFFGNSYNQFLFSSNGWISFDTALTNSYLSNYAIPTVGVPNDIIAWFWDDMDPFDNPDGDTYIYYETMTVGSEQALVLSMLNYHEYSGSGTGKLTCQVILYEGGKVKIQYEGFYGGIDMLGATVGIENSDGTLGVQYHYNGTEGPLVDGLAVAFSTDPMGLGDEMGMPAPSNLAIQVSGSDIQLSWDGVTEATSYYVYRAASPTDAYVPIAGPIATTSYSDTGVATGVKYWYYVTASDDAPTRSNTVTTPDNARRQ